MSRSASISAATTSSTARARRPASAPPSLTLCFAVTYAIQRVILQWRVQRITGAGRQDVGAPTTSS